MHFPKHFLIGAAMAGHQVEGNNLHSNWWDAESQGKIPPSGMAADHYRKFDSDFALAHSLGLNAMRISIEWSRLEPGEGEWNEAAIAHYHHVFKSLRKHGHIPMVTLFHWTMPLWFAERGGFAVASNLKYFKRFVRKVAREYGKHCQLWLTVNEPEVFAFDSYLFGKHVPFEKNARKALTVYRNLFAAHKAAYVILKRYIPHVRVGVAKNVALNIPFRSDHPLDKLVAWVGNKLGNEFFIDRVKNHIDFIGLNYYFTHLVKFDIWSGFIPMNEQFPMSDMGIKTNPQGLYKLLKRFEKYNKPLYVTENGIANASDNMRVRFIKEHLAAVYKARLEGVPVKGYFHWSLLDTYEWQDGFDRKFGLAEVDFQTQKRTLRVANQLFHSFRKK